MAKLRATNWQCKIVGANLSKVVETEIARIQSLGGAELGALWRKEFRRLLPLAIGRDLQVRMLAWRIQEQAYGGHGPEALAVLEGLARGRPREALLGRSLRPGTELVREHQGRRHTVTIKASGFSWEGREYPSLSAIARAITGAAWNGPRFFGLRGSQPAPERAYRKLKRAVKGVPIAKDVTSLAGEAQ